MDPLREMFRHHAWATDRLIELCGELPSARLDAAAPGTYGSVLATLVHLVAADQRFLDFFTGNEPETRVREGMTPSMADLRSAFAPSAARWDELVTRAGDLVLDIPARGQRPAIPHAEDLLFVQAIHHGNDHRTQVCTTLSAAGVEPPSLDEWTHWFETHPDLGAGGA